MGITHTHNSTYLSDLPGASNQRWRASFEFLPKKRGNDHLVFRGRMFRPGHDYYLTKRHAAVKVSKMKPAYAKDWEHYVRCEEEARKYCRMFNDIIQQHSLKIQISFLRSCAAPLDTVSKVTAKVLAKKYKRKMKSGEYVIIESFLYGKFQDFISVIGEVLDKRIGILEAFSHFTYWQSSGELIVCSLKGVRSTVDRGEDGEWKVLELTSPCIHSIDGDYGPDDLGEEGMKMFFEHHKCNRVCDSWADFETLNSRRLLNNSLIPADADDAAHADIIERLPEDKQDTKGSPEKEKVVIGFEAFENEKIDSSIENEKNRDIMKSPPNSYIKPLSTDYVSIHADENDSGCESLPTDSCSNDSLSSAHSYDFAPEKINLALDSETTKRAYVKCSVAEAEIDHVETTIPKHVYLGTDLWTENTWNKNMIVFQNDGDGTMKPINENGYVQHDDIDIKIERPNETSLDSSKQKKMKRVSWSV